MEPHEAAKVIARIMARYPNWVGGLSVEEQKFTVAEWAEELMEFAEQDVHYVWHFAKECMGKDPSAFPPGITEITLYIRKAIFAEHRRQRQDKEQKQLEDDRAERRGMEASPAAEECFAAVKKLTEGMTKYVEEERTPSDCSDKANWTGINRAIQERKNQPKVDTTPLRAEDFKKDDGPWGQN